MIEFVAVVFDVFTTSSSLASLMLHFQGAGVSLKTSSFNHAMSKCSITLQERALIMGGAVTERI